MSNVVAEAFSRLVPDPWRKDTGFKPDLREASDRLFSATEDVERAAIVEGWLHKHQPCLFGRIAAKGGFLSFCFLTEEDLNSPDAAIRDKIQDARRSWTRDAFEGRKSGFVIVAVSEQIANAQPDDAVKDLALRLCSLYLLQEVIPDQILLDDIYLEIRNRDTTTWKWNAGVNYFSAHGDGRWWQDHRIPGGMAFSVNSVGHMVKSDILKRGMVELERDLGFSAEVQQVSKVDSLGKALDLAMRTINNASDGPSGKATHLFPIPKDDFGHPIAECPVALPSVIAGKNFQEYWGGYHTDVTVPSEYFRPDVARPAGLPEHILDFTYLFVDNVDNPDYATTGEGRRIRVDEDEEASGTPRKGRSGKYEPESVAISECERLVSSLREMQGGE